MAVKLSADTFEESLGFLENFAKAAVKAPQNSVPMIVGGVVGGLTYFNNKREGEDTLPSLSSALVAGGLAGLATNSMMHHFDLPSRGPSPKVPDAAPHVPPQTTPAPTVPNSSTPTVNNPATPTNQNSAPPVVNASSTPKGEPTTRNTGGSTRPAAPVPDKSYEGVDLVPSKKLVDVVGGAAQVTSTNEQGQKVTEAGKVPEHLKGGPPQPTPEDLAFDAAEENEPGKNAGKQGKNENA